MSDENVTTPTIEKILERIALMEARLADKLERLDVRLDRIESEVKQTHSELFTLRADFLEFSRSHKEPA